MKSLLTLPVWRSISRLPVLGQQKDTVEQRITHQRDLLGDANALGEFGELGLKLDDAYNRNDAAAVAELFTEDGVLLAPDGMFSGPQDIKKRYSDTFQRSPISDFNSRRERYHLNAIDNAVWSAGQWAATLQSESDRCSARAA